MRSFTSPDRPPRTGGGQLLLFPAAPRSAGRARGRGGGPAAGAARAEGRNARMAARLERLARAAEREALDCRRAGDAVGEREARDRAADAHRAAGLLRAGPAGVARVLAS